MGLYSFVDAQLLHLVPYVEHMVPIVVACVMYAAGKRLNQI